MTYIYYKSHKWIYECELEKFNKTWISNIKGKQVIFKVSKTLKKFYKKVTKYKLNKIFWVTLKFTTKGNYKCL